MTYFFIFLFGSIIGSFLNVCIYRIPREESIVFPGSRCPLCRKPIPWYCNIPFFSYIFLRGKCKFCGNKISIRYFIVEFIAAASFLFLFFMFGFNLKFYIYSLMTFSLIVVTFIDLDFQIIPDRISVGGMFLGIVVSAIRPELHSVVTYKEGIIRSALGILVGGGLIYCIRFLGNMSLYIVRYLGVRYRRNPVMRKRFAKYRHMKESMGWGDVKLMAMFGAFLGWKMSALVFFLAPFFAAPIGLYLKIYKKYDIIPYGPYLSLAAFVVMVWGHNIFRMLFF